MLVVLLRGVMVWLALQSVRRRRLYLGGQKAPHEKLMLPLGEIARVAAGCMLRELPLKSLQWLALLPS